MTDLGGLADDGHLTAARDAHYRAYPRLHKIAAAPPPAAATLRRARPGKPVARPPPPLRPPGRHFVPGHDPLEPRAGRDSARLLR